MGRCVFKSDDLKRCVEHALAAKDFRMCYSSEPPQPALLFVHDEGVYFMSNGLPIDDASEHGPKKQYIVHAKHCDPNKDDDYWDNAKNLVGGDDFVEVITVDPSWLASIDEFAEVHVEVEADSLSVYFANPRKKPSRVRV